MEDVKNKPKFKESREEARDVSFVSQLEFLIVGRHVTSMQANHKIKFHHQQFDIQ